MNLPFTELTKIAPLGWGILVVANIPVYFGLGWVWFKDWEDFFDSVKFWLTPNFISAIRDEYFEDWWGTTKLGFWAASCAACVFVEALLVQRYLMH